MRYFIKISYDGSKFYGFQRLKGHPTIQGRLEEMLSIIDKGPVVVKGAGRTDRGVHAHGQGVHFDLHHDIPVDRLKKVLNKMISPYIHVIDCKQVSNDFHARFSVLEKEYIYRIYLGNFDPFLYDYTLEYGYPLHLSSLKKVGKLLEGKHYFDNFVSGEREQCAATITKVHIKRVNREVWIIFRGKGFYRYMVRNMVGAMLDYNEGKCDLLDIQNMLNQPTIKKQLRTAPATGLYLENVYYE